MKPIKIFITFILWLQGGDPVFAQATPALSAKDFKLFKGRWYGSLTYLDYSSGKSYTMPADLDVKQIGLNKFIFTNTYPNEPKANTADTITISGDGKTINQEVVKSVRKPNNRNTEIITEHGSEDGNDNKPALIRYTYTVGNKIFTRKKEVQFAGETKWLKRHEYSYSRNKPGG